MVENDKRERHHPLCLPLSDLLSVTGKQVGSHHGLCGFHHKIKLYLFFVELVDLTFHSHPRIKYL